LKHKPLMALNIAFLIAFLAPYVMQAYCATANAYAYHPEVKLYGDVTKPVYPGRSIFEYKDDQGLSSILPFERQDENVSIIFANMVFSKAFENKSISDASETKADELTTTLDVLTTSNGQEYIYLKAENSSALSATKTYSAKEKLLVSDEPTVTNDYYVFVTAKVDNTGTNLSLWEVSVKFYFKDSGATERTLEIKVDGGSGSDAWGSSDTNVVFHDYNRDNTFVTWQFKIQDMLDKESKAWVLSKLTAVEYGVRMITGSSPDAALAVEAWIRHALVLPSKVYIDDPAYTNGLIVNGTSVDFTSQAGDVIQLYGANATKIVGVTIPFVMEDSRDFDESCTTIPESYGFLYDWKFILPKSPSTGDSLTYSNTNVTLKSWFDGAYVDSLYVNGVDKTTQVSSKKVDTSTGLNDADRAWIYLVASSLTAGNQYDVELKVENLPSDV